MESIPPLFEEENDFYAPTVSAEANASFSLPGHQSLSLPGSTQALFSPGAIFQQSFCSSQSLSTPPSTQFISTPPSTQSLSTPPSTQSLSTPPSPGSTPSLSNPTSSTSSSLPLVPSLIPPTVSFACRKGEIIPVKEKKRPRKPSPPRNKRPSSSQQLDNFLAKGCRCAGKCYQQFDREYFELMQVSLRGTLWTWW